MLNSVQYKDNNNKEVNTSICFILRLVFQRSFGEYTCNFLFTFTGILCQEVPRFSVLLLEEEFWIKGPRKIGNYTKAEQKSFLHIEKLS